MGRQTGILITFTHRNNNSQESSVHFWESLCAYMKSDSLQRICDIVILLLQTQKCTLARTGHKHRKGSQKSQLSTLLSLFKGLQSKALSDSIKLSGLISVIGQSRVQEIKKKQRKNSFSVWGHVYDTHPFLLTSFFLRHLTPLWTHTPSKRGHKWGAGRWLRYQWFLGVGLFE